MSDSESEDDKSYETFFNEQKKMSFCSWKNMIK